MKIKKILISALILVFTCLSTFASEIIKLPYQNLDDNSKLTVNSNSKWTAKVNYKTANRFVRKGSVLYKENIKKNFDTQCDYLFINKSSLIGYSSTDMKFYKFSYSGNCLIKQKLSYDEVASLFKNFKIILISNFSATTNVYKYKKTNDKENILILNDTDNVFDNYSFTTNNAKFKKYNINNAICITKSGMIQFSRNNNNGINHPWFILLVR